MQIGIDRIGFYTPKQAFLLDTLARNRGIDPQKFTHGLGQEMMSVPNVFEDVVTMACEACYDIVDFDKLKEDIDFVLFATESSFDYSKSAGVYLHELLGLNKNCRVVELKQACYAGTAAINIAKSHILQNENSKCLVVCSDVALYGLKSAGEPTQGAGAIAMIISKNPAIGELDTKHAYYCENQNDFWRPIGRKTPIVDGHKSIKIYLQHLAETYNQYLKLNGLSYHDHSKFCYHLPFAKIASKANDILNIDNDKTDKISHGQYYTSLCGNLYNGSLFLSLLSTLECDLGDLSGLRIGMFSYGSGSMSEFFSIKIKKNYKSYIKSNRCHALSTRVALGYSWYEDVVKELLDRDYQENYTTDTTSALSTHNIVLKEILNDQRIYESKSK